MTDKIMKNIGTMVSYDQKNLLSLIKKGTTVPLKMGIGL